MLPLKTPLKARDVTIDIYDPTIFVDFSFEKKDPVALENAPAGCKIGFQLPREMTFAGGQAAGTDPRRREEHVDGVGRAVRQQDQREMPVMRTGWLRCAVLFAIAVLILCAADTVWTVLHAQPFGHARRAGARPTSAV